MQKVLSTTLRVLPLAVALSAGAQAATQDSALLVYQVWEPGLQPYLSRMLVTENFLRIDEGEGAADYTLFDRQQKIIYNVSHEDRSALVMNPPSQEIKRPDSLVLEERISRDAQAPNIASLPPQNLSLLANGQVCRDLVTVPGLLPEAVAAMREFQQVLARVQAATLGTIPEDMQTPCDLADNVYAPLRPLDHGLPIQERSASRSRSLVDFVTDHPVEESQFGIPENYGRVPMPGLMAGE